MRRVELLEGIIEVDEVYIGGLESNKHQSKRTTRGGTKNKTMVLGAIQRNGKLKTKVIKETSIENVSKAVQEFVAQESTLVTDENHAYTQVGKKYNHKKINHREKEYLKREEIPVHTDSIEGYWNILRKQLDGIHHSVSPKHLQRYCDENAFRFNNPESFQDERFANALANCNGRLKYEDLTAKDEKCEKI
jgi:hypothetical protein